MSTQHIGDAEDARIPTPQLDSLTEVTATLACTAPIYDRNAEFPHEGIQAVHDAGLLTSTVGRSHGGADLGIADTARVLAALGEGDPSVALISAMTLFIHAKQARGTVWPEKLYARILAESAQRPTLINSARVEPELGSPSRGGLPATVARSTSAGWLISGHKRFTTGAAGLSYFLVWAATDESAPRVGTFVVPADSAGIEIEPTWNHLGLRASGSHDVVFREVEIPPDHVIELTDGTGAEQDNLAVASLGLPLAAVYLGVGRAAQEYFHRFAHERVPTGLGRPVATTERFRQAAGEIEVLLAGAEQLLFSTAERLDRGENLATGRALAARILANRQTVAAVQIAVRLLGNPGLSQDNPLERHFRDVQCAPVHAPQEDTSLLVIGSAVLDAAAPS
jgi:alkylation response protein AidB-like acyl-CoA dehydrogenase